MINNWLKIVSDYKMNKTTVKEVELIDDVKIALHIRPLKNHERDELMKIYYIDGFLNSYESIQRLIDFNYELVSLVLVEPKVSVKDLRELDVVTFNKVLDAVTSVIFE